MNSDIATTAKLGGTAGLKELLEAATPGPWVLVGPEPLVCGEQTWCLIGKGRTVDLHGEDQPNAQLAAAAPDLTRLVLTLHSRLAAAAIGQHYYHRSPGTEYELPTADQCDEEQECKDNRAALAAVEEL